MLPINKIICGAAEDVLKTFPDNSFNCCISSPPYWALRDYGIDGQLGLEPTFEEYIDKLCGIYDLVKPKLRPDGTCWVNLGDTYNAGRSGGWAGGKHGISKPENSPNQSGVNAKNIPTKSLCLIPQRFAIEMVNRGWILRNTIIWHKPNPMPSSAKDRFTVDFEYVYFFVKNKRYWFEPQYEPQLKTRQEGKCHMPARGKDVEGVKDWAGEYRYYNPLGRNKRCVWEVEDPAYFIEWLKVNQPEFLKQMYSYMRLAIGTEYPSALWTIPTQSFPQAHFATYPEKLVEPMIKAGCPEFVCTKCGRAREKVWDTEYHNQSMTETEKYSQQNKKFGTNPTYGRGESKHYFKGYTDCKCGKEFRPGIVLDCFCRCWHYLESGRSVAA
jgi:DNA modification methylase